MCSPSIYHILQSILMEKTYSSLAAESEEKRNIADLGLDYVETYTQLMLVKFNQKTADISAVASFAMLGGLFFMMIFIFLGVATSLWLGAITGSNALGFLLTGVFSLLIFLILFFTRKKIFYPFIKNLIIESIYE